jgi:Uma2 family endonuclease
MLIDHIERPRIWRMSVSRYDRLAELGWFVNRHVELIEGRVIRMPAQAEPHVAGVSRAVRAISPIFGPGYYIRVQAPLVQGKYSKPEPDLAVVRGSEEQYLAQGTPTTALLVIEVSDATLEQDRGRKAAIYARSGIADYWIVNLINQQIEVHRAPVADRKHRFGFRYADIQLIKPPSSIAPLAAPGASISAADLLPPVPQRK